MVKSTLKDVANRANVSVTTASLILNGRKVRASEQTREAVLKAARDLQYVPNALIRSLQTRRTNTLGVFLGVGKDILNVYIGTLFNAIRDAAEERGYDLLVYRTGRDDSPVDVRQFLDARVEGLLYWEGYRPISYPDLARSHLPVVVLLGCPDQRSLARVLFDDLGGMQQVLEHLLGLGHRRIAYIAGAEPLLPHLRTRLHVFLSTVERLGGEGIHSEALIGRSRHEIQQQINQLLRREQHPTAVISATDFSTFLVLKAAHAAGFTIPDDLSLVNWEDVGGTPYYNMDYTAVRHDVTLLGREAVDLLSKIIDEKPIESRRIVLPVDFRVGHTTGLAPM